MSKRKLLGYGIVFLVGLTLVTLFDRHLEYCLKLNYLTARNAYLTSCIETVKDLPIKTDSKTTLVIKYCNPMTEQYLEWIYGK